MANPARERMRKLVEQLEQDPALVEQLPSQEGAVVHDALAGQSVHLIAQNHQLSEGAVWRILGTAARAATGQSPAAAVETGGLGSDTDPGVTGGYGDTGLGSLSNEPPYPVPEEPTEQA